MTHGSLFNGIGGFQLAAHWMGWENVMHCEIDEFCNKVVKKHFPNSIQHGNIKTTDFSIYRGRIDIITGGFPCQPYSTAGKRKGSEDDRHLWPEMLRAIREISPRWVVGENVRGLTNWNGGLVFDQVQAELEAEGYEVLPFLLPACSVRAPHRRDRIWFIAYTAGYSCYYESGNERHKAQAVQENGFNEPVIAANTNNKRLQRRQVIGGFRAVRENTSEQFTGFLPSDWQDFPTQPPLCGRDDGISDRVDRVEALGNAIVPQVALQIFKAIEQYEIVTA